jgi:hypothetical protein
VTETKTKTLGQVLKVLLDESNYFDRAEWARFFGRKEEILESWVSDATIPPPSFLAMLLDLLRHTDAIPSTVFEQWKSVSELPAINVVPCIRDKGFAANLSEIDRLEVASPIINMAGYVLWPRYQSIFRYLTSLSSEEQEKVLDILRDQIIPDILEKRK